MSSSRPTIAAVREYMVKELKPLLPRRWKVIGASEAVPVVTVPSVYLQFTEINTEQDGAPMSIDGGSVEAVFDLVVVVPRASDTGRSEDVADGAVLDLLIALKAHDHIGWGPTAKKGIDADSGGQIFWRVPVAVIATAPTPDTN